MTNSLSSSSSSPSLPIEVPCLFYEWGAVRAWLAHDLGLVAKVLVSCKQELRKQDQQDLRELKLLWPMSRRQAAKWIRRQRFPLQVNQPFAVISEVEESRVEEPGEALYRVITKDLPSLDEVNEMDDDQFSALISVLATL